MLPWKQGTLHSPAFPQQLAVTELSGQLTPTAQQLEEQLGVTWFIQCLEGRAQEKASSHLRGFLACLGWESPLSFPSEGRFFP